MTKSELTQALSEELSLPLATGSGIINTILDAMVETLVKGENIEIRGFGSFTVKHYDSYTGRNPKTGRPLQITARKVLTFKPSNVLREIINS